MKHMTCALAVVACVALAGCKESDKTSSTQTSTTTTTTTTGTTGSASTTAPAATSAPATGAAGGTAITRADGLKIEDLVVGTGATAEAGKTVSVNYTGWLIEKSKADHFDSSLDRGQPFDFPLGQGRVIKGWDEGVAGMKVGGKRMLTIPPSLGYGSQGAGGVIPPNATLVFEVDLLDVR